MRRRAARALGVIAVLAAVVAPTRVAADDLKDDLQRVTDRIRSVAEQIDDVGEERSRLAAEIRAAGGRLERLLTDVTTAEAGLVGAQSDMNAATVRLNAIQARLHDSYSHLYATRISIADTRSAAIESARNAYLSGDSEISVLAISAERLTEVSIALEYLARASGTTGEALATLVLLETREQDQQVMIREQETAMDADLVAMKALQADMEEARDGLDLERGRVEEAIAGLESLLTELDLELPNSSTSSMGSRPSKSESSARSPRSRRRRSLRSPRPGSSGRFPGSLRPLSDRGNTRSSDILECTRASTCPPGTGSRSGRRRMGS